MGGRYWRFAPLILLAMAVAVFGNEFLVTRPAGFVPALVLAVLCVFVALTLVQLQQLEGLLKQVLGQFKQFHATLKGEDGSGGPGAVRDPATERQAVEILVGALGSEDDNVRRTAAENLARLTGVDHGQDAAAWRRWLAESGR